VIVLDTLATDLGIERRRIYDIVNILEVVDIVRDFLACKMYSSKMSRFRDEARTSTCGTVGRESRIAWTNLWYEKSLYHFDSRYRRRPRVRSD